MGNAILYYRTPTTLASDPLYDTVAELLSAFPLQCLQFTFPDDIFEGISEQYENNVRSIPIPNQDGSRTLNIQENGLNSYNFTISGVFGKNTAVGIQRLKSFRKRLQVDTTHVYGAFGIQIDNASEFNIIPTPTKGLYIKSTNIGYAGQRTTRYDFQVTLGFGGTL